MRCKSKQSAVKVFKKAVILYFFNRNLILTKVILFENTTFAKQKHGKKQSPITKNHKSRILYLQNRFIATKALPLRFVNNTLFKKIIWKQPANDSCKSALRLNAR